MRHYTNASYCHHYVLKIFHKNQNMYSYEDMASQMVLVIKNLPAYAGNMTWVQSLGWEDPLEKGMATHSSILVWRIQ